VIGGDVRGAEGSFSGIGPLECFHTAVLFPPVLGEHGIDHAVERFDEGAFEAEVDGDASRSRGSTMTGSIRMATPVPICRRQCPTTGNHAAGHPGCGE
jgi:hypothetical protein